MFTSRGVLQEIYPRGRFAPSHSQASKLDLSSSYHVRASPCCKFAVLIVDGYGVCLSPSGHSDIVQSAEDEFKVVLIEVALGGGRMGLGPSEITVVICCLRQCDADYDLQR